jgi:major type 1 subunit fimbrin (pilin)
MNKNIIYMALTTALGIATLVSQNANAVDGTININGKVVADTCLISINQSTAEATGTQQVGGAGTAANTVTLNTVPAGMFLGTAGTIVESAPVTINYTACTGLATVQPNFSASANVNSSTGYMTSTAAPIGVDLMLSQTAGGTALNLTNPNAVPAVDASSGAAEVDLFASYISNSGTVTPGPVTTAVTFTTNYQ